MYKKLLKIILAHLAVIIYWGILYKLNLSIEDAPVINLVSFLLIFTVYIFIYTELSNKNIGKKYTIIFSFLSIVPIALSLQKNIDYKYILIILSLVSSFIYAKRYLLIDHAKDINILPISKASAQVFTILLAILSLLMIYLFDISSFVINIFIHIIMLLIESFFLIFLKEKELSYEKTYRLYYLAEYMSEERDNFARVIHDEIIQDIFASRNYLSLKNPDVEHAKKVLSNLESKSRQIMKLYQANLFEKLDINTSISSIIDNVSSLYNKNLDINLNINQKLFEESDDNLIKLIAVVSKELINNIYKHSKASYLNYKLYSKISRVFIEIESDGTSVEDYNRIKDSKRGLLLLKLLIDMNSGELYYELNKDILKTKVILEVFDEDNIIR
ncbi:histidine kinase [Anaerosphaera sp. HMSC064C01]|nr:histidine kinase [Anaerosphaera sp. HMSC064C01]